MFTEFVNKLLEDPTLEVPLPENMKRGIKEEDFYVFFANRYLFRCLERELSRKRGFNKNIIIFLHIPKTAGTSLYEIFYRIFKERLSPPLLESFLIPFYFFIKYDVLWGHFLFEDIRHISFNKKIISFVRDPIETLWSNYRYWRSFDDKDPLSNIWYVKLAKEKSPEDFFSDPRIKEMMENSLSYRILDFPTYFNIKSKISEMDEKSRISYLENEVRYIIREHIRKHFLFIGLTERFKESVKAIFKKLEVDVPNNLLNELISVRINVSPKYEMPEGLREKLIDCTQLDNILYEEVISVFHNETEALGKDMAPKFEIKKIINTNQKILLYGFIHSLTPIHSVSSLLPDISIIYYRDKKDFNVLCILPKGIFKVPLMIKYSNESQVVELKL